MINRWPEMTFSARRTILGGVMLACLATFPAHAQQLETGAITLDIEDTDSGSDELLLVAAFQPQEGAAPIIGDALNVERVALRTDADRPQPSIILGLIEAGREEDFGIESLLPETVATFGFSWDDLEAREALRESDLAMLVKLVEGGHIDPPSDRINAALQTDLRRMNCYRSSIDNQWGRGSRRSVGEYFSTLDKDGVTWPDQEPSVELFRTIVINGDVRCVVAAAPARPASTPSTSRNTSSTTRSTTTTTTTTTRQAPAQTTTQQPTQQRRATPGVGVFR